MIGCIEGKGIRLGHNALHMKLTKSVLDKNVNMGYTYSHCQHSNRAEDAMKAARFFLLFSAFLAGAYFLVVRTPSPSQAQPQSSGGGVL